MNKTVLITGASGLIGKPLTRMLLEKGYIVHHLSRSPSAENPNVNVFLWDVYRRKIDENCITGVDAIIHLAGEGIADKRWTRKRKQQIIESRTESIRLIYGLLKKKDHQVKTIISASGVGYYSNRGDELLTEESAPSADFLAHTCVEWEKAVEEGKASGLRIVKFRTGIVLSASAGALPQLAKPLRFGLGAALGSGKQWMPWIHLTDAVNMYIFALENNNTNTVYNMCAPNPVTNKTFTRALAKCLNKPLWLPNVPALALKLALGEMSTAVLGSTKASAAKIESEGFSFRYRTIEEALKEIYKP